MLTVTDEASLRNSIRELVMEIAPNRKIKKLEPKHRLVEDLAYHSLALLELAFTLEDEYGLDQIDEKQARAIISAADIEQHVVEELRRKGQLK